MVSVLQDLHDVAEWRGAHLELTVTSLIPNTNRRDLAILRVYSDTRGLLATGDIRRGDVERTAAKLLRAIERTMS